MEVVLPHPVQNLETAHRGHHQVEDDHVGRVPRRKTLYRTMPVGGCSRLVASVAEYLRDRQDKVFIIVDDEHARGCLLPPFHRFPRMAHGAPRSEERRGGKEWG